MRNSKFGPSDEQFARLPKYAQRYIESLEQVLDEMRADHKAVDAGNTSIRWYDPSVRKQNTAEGSCFTHLPDRANIEFFVDKVSRVTVSHQTMDRRFHDMNHIIRVASDWGRLIVVPEASNSITILTEDRLKSTGR